MLGLSLLRRGSSTAPHQPDIQTPSTLNRSCAHPVKKGGAITVELYSLVDLRLAQVLTLWTRDRGQCYNIQATRSGESDEMAFCEFAQGKHANPDFWRRKIKDCALHVVIPKDARRAPQDPRHNPRKLIMLVPLPAGHGAVCVHLQPMAKTN